MSDPTSLAIDKIRVGTRHRKDMGDLEALAASMVVDTQLQRIGVRPDGVLVFGARRLAAAKLLGWTEIKVDIVHGFEDELRLRRAELKENTAT